MLKNRRNDITSLISPCKRKGEKGEKIGVFVWGIRMGYSYLVTHPSTNHKEKGLTLLSGQNTFHSFVRVQDKVSKLTNCTNFRMIQAMIKYIERSAVDRIEENSNDVSRNLHCHTLSSVFTPLLTRPRREEEQEVGK